MYKFGKNEFPTQTEIKQCLGPDLAKLLFQQSDQEIQLLLGLIPPLNGIENPIWIAPEDQINHNNVFTSVPKSDEIKTFTHQTILDLGDDFMRNTQIEIERKVKQFQRVHTTEQTLMMEAAKRQEIDSILQETHQRFNNYLENLRNDFQMQLQNELREHSERYKKEFQKAIVEERMNLTQRLLSQMRHEISLIITSLYDEFQLIKRQERENLIAYFNDYLRKNSIQKCEGNYCRS